MPTPTQTKIAPAPKPCFVTRKPDGTLTVTVNIDPATAERYLSRANGMDIAKYLYENVLKRAIEGHVF